MPITDQDRQRIARKSRKLTLQARDRKAHFLGGWNGPLVGCDKDGNPYRLERPAGLVGSGKGSR